MALEDKPGMFEIGQAYIVHSPTNAYFIKLGKV
jgi:hypothetical protein